MVIYKTTNLISGKFYIGQDQRNNPNYFGSGIILKRALKKYGKENFIKEILEECDNREKLNEREIFWIKSLNAIKDGYNIASGGGGGNRLGIKLSISIREKISRSKKGVSWGHHSEKTKKKLSELKKGIKFTNKHKKHLSEKRKLRITKQETIEKMKISMIGKNVKYRYILLGPDNKEYIIDNKLKYFCNDHNIDRRNLLTRRYSKGWTLLKKEEKTSHVNN